MTYVAEIIRSVGGSVADGATCVGNAWTLISPTGGTGKRSGLWICHDPEQTSATRAYLLFVNRGSATPTVSTKASNQPLTGGVPVLVPVAETVDVYIRNSSNAATTSVYSTKELSA